jgi:4-diphosphocytidyl-2-C-methyl-D-erythritol kinase
VSSPVALVENAPAKVNLTLRVLGRRADGYHEIESLVAFADFGDSLRLVPSVDFALNVRGPGAGQSGAVADNLVLKAARALADQVRNLQPGAFDLDKRLPVAAGLGGGSADAAAALRLMARINGLAADDARLFAAARATGADVPVCLDPQPRLMRGIGEVLSKPLRLPAFDAVLVNPGVALATKAVFAGWSPAGVARDRCDPALLERLANRDELLRFLAAQSNDLEAPAIAIEPVIAEVLQALRALPGSRLSRMSGSGATCFALFESAASAQAAEKILHSKYQHWWVRACVLGSGHGDAEDKNAIGA